jgi:hypothetical protein
VVQLTLHTRKEDRRDGTLLSAIQGHACNNWRDEYPTDLPNAARWGRGCSSVAGFRVLAVGLAV